MAAIAFDDHDEHVAFREQGKGITDEMERLGIGFDAVTCSDPDCDEQDDESDDNRSAHYRKLKDGSLEVRERKA